MLPGPHIYGSLYWFKGEVFTEQPLGEVLAGPRPWFNGAITGPVPVPRTIGDPSCLYQGGTYPPPAVSQTSPIFGLEALCFVQEFQPFPTTIADWDITAPDVQLAIAQIIDWLYQDTTLIEPTLQAWLGSGITVQIISTVTGQVPDSVIVNTPNYVLVIMSGTRSDALLANQALQLSAGLTNFGQYSTIPLWQDGQAAIHQRIIDVIGNSTKPVLLAGHSYGGVVATLLAGRYHQGDPTRPVRLLTFGMPKPGDARVETNLGTVPRVHLVNDDDFVPVMPPDLGFLAWLLPTLPAAVASAWRQLRPPSGRLLMAVNGTQTPMIGDALPWSIIVETVARVLGGLPPPEFDGHTMKQYLLRLRQLAGPDGRYPLPSDIKADLTDSPVSDNVATGATGTLGDAIISTS